MSRYLLVEQNPVVAANAVAAILVLARGRYLAQLRDDKPGIWYPGHWGLFGGAVDDGETARTGLRRELREELGLHVEELVPFTRFEFDLKPIGGGHVWREYFTAEIGETDLGNLVLGEGQRVEAFAAEELLLKLRMVPYDAFALWLHAKRIRMDDCFSDTPGIP